VLDLPEGSVPIDFAYRVHTGVGNSCVGAKVNGKIVPLDYHLKNGDIVEIITSRRRRDPAGTGSTLWGPARPRTRSNSSSRRNGREENIVNGREMLERECRRLGYDVNTMLTPENLKEVASRTHMDGSVENLLAALGYGGLMVNSVMVKLVDLYKKAQKKNTNKNLSQLLSELKPRR
jgi:GTP diphosphokinase / guanosine-3',5'-bis(diphosphate) 3'-diphosphatase